MISHAATFPMENAAPAAGAALSRVRQLQHGQLEHDSDDMQLAAARSSRKALTIAAALASSAAADGGVAAAAAALSTPTASALSTTDSDFAGSDRGTVDGDDKVAALTAACRTILEVRACAVPSSALWASVAAERCCCGRARGAITFLCTGSCCAVVTYHHLITHFPFLPAASISTTTVTHPAPSVPG